MKYVSWLGARLKEPSTYAGLAAIGTAAGVALNAVSTGAYVVAVGAALAGAVAFCKAEGLAVPVVLTEAQALLPTDAVVTAKAVS